MDNLGFSNWTLWEGPHSVEGSELPGVYLLAVFDPSHDKRVDTRASEVIYVGETCSQTLEKR